MFQHFHCLELLWNIFLLWFRMPTDFGFERNPLRSAID
jgi:hypothetical protein